MPRTPPLPDPTFSGLEPNVSRQDAQPREDITYRRSDLPELENDPRQVRPAAAIPPEKQEKRVLIRLEPNGNIPPGGLYIGHNGRNWLLKPARPVRVPIPLLNVLDDAVEDRPVVDPDTLIIMGWEKQRRYPYTILRDPEAERQRAA